MTSLHVLTPPGSWDTPAHFYPRVPNAQLHPLVKHFLHLGNHRIAERYAHLHPEANRESDPRPPRDQAPLVPLVGRRPLPHHRRARRAPHGAHRDEQLALGPEVDAAARRGRRPGGVRTPPRALLPAHAQGAQGRRRRARRALGQERDGGAGLRRRARRAHGRAGPPCLRAGRRPHREGRRRRRPRPRRHDLGPDPRRLPLRHPGALEAPAADHQDPADEPGDRLPRRRPKQGPRREGLQALQRPLPGDGAPDPHPRDRRQRHPRRGPPPRRAPRRRGRPQGALQQRGPGRRHRHQPRGARRLPGGAHPLRPLPRAGAHRQRGLVELGPRRPPLPRGHHPRHQGPDVRGRPPADDRRQPRGLLPRVDVRAPRPRPAPVRAPRARPHLGCPRHEPVAQGGRRLLGLGLRPPDAHGLPRLQPAGRRPRRSHRGLPPDGDGHGGDRRHGPAPRQHEGPLPLPPVRGH